MRFLKQNIKKYKTNEIMFKFLLKKISTLIEVTEIVEEAPETFTFKFAVPENIKWKLGTYAHFLATDLEGNKPFKENLVREISIMSHPNENYIGFTTRIRSNASDFKRALGKLQVGDKIRIFFFGSHIKLPKTKTPVVFISMGVGIATFRPFIKELLEKYSETTITNINIERSGKFVYQDELSTLPADKVKNVLVSSRKELYASIDKTLSNKDNVYYVVGSKQFNKDIGKYLKQNNVDKKSIRFDKQ